MHDDLLHEHLDGASVGIGPVGKDLLKERLGEAVDAVVKGQEDELGGLLLRKAT